MKLHKLLESQNITKERIKTDKKLMVEAGVAYYELIVRLRCGSEIRGKTDWADFVVRKRKYLTNGTHKEEASKR
jgi:hypothetical protein